MLVDLGRNDLGRVAADRLGAGNQLMAVERIPMYAPRLEYSGATCSPARTPLTCCGPLSRRHPARRAQDQGHADHRRTGAHPPRPLRRRCRLFQLLRQHGFLAITIRTFVIRNGKIYIQAGAGIVADSDPHSEYKETLSKAEGLVQALKMAAAGFEVKTA